MPSLLRGHFLWIKITIWMYDVLMRLNHHLIVWIKSNVDMNDYDCKIILLENNDEHTKKVT